MRIGNTEVETPYDDETAYKPDWRFNVAKALSDTKATIPADLRHERDILTCVDALNGAKTNNTYAAIAYKDYYKVFNWQREAGREKVKFYLEALLLTDQNYKVIAADLNTTPDRIRLYEKLFFNIRDNEGVLLPSNYLRLRFALNGTPLNANTPIESGWLAVGASVGYAALTYIWGWPSPAGEITKDDEDYIFRQIFKAIQAKNIDRVMRGLVDSEDSSAIMAAYIAYQKLKLDASKDGKGQTNKYDLALRLLQAAAPKMLMHAKTEDEKYEITEAIRRKFAAAKAIDATKIEDKGYQVGIAAVNESLNKAVQLTKM